VEDIGTSEMTGWGGEGAGGKELGSGACSSEQKSVLPCKVQEWQVCPFCQPGGDAEVTPRGFFQNHFLPGSLSLPRDELPTASSGAGGLSLALPTQKQASGQLCTAILYQGVGTVNAKRMSG
jgi:hypothetical protein